jgi:hypothetical protein
VRHAAFLAFLALLLLPAGRAAAMSRDEMQRLLAEATGFFNEASAKAGTDDASARDLYQKALLRFTRLVDEGGVRNGRLYYDLGNTQFHLGKLGEAILAYKRAQLYAPGDPNLQQNLEFARGKRVDKIEEKERTKVLRILFFWHYDLPSSLRLGLFAAAFAALFLSAAARLLWKRGFLPWILGISLAVALLFAASLAADSLALFTEREGVILRPEVTARKGNALSYEASFQEPLHEGTEFLLREERTSWYYVELADGRLCWVPTETAGLVR